MPAIEPFEGFRAEWDGANHRIRVTADAQPPFTLTPHEVEILWAWAKEHNLS